METFANHLRTSVTHPIKIDTLPAGNGAIGLTFCPGKKQHQSMTGGWNRNVTTDLDAIHVWGADIVISLMERFEYAEIHVPELPELFEQQFQLWLDLPIIDKCAPTSEWLGRWRLTRLVVANALINGQRILIHCKGGLGRTGTIAAMILHDLGMPMAEAMAQVRTTREGTIETLEQEQFLADYSQTPITPRAIQAVMSFLNGALGDAIGEPLEFLNQTEIANKYPQQLSSLIDSTESLCISDDTQMTLYTLSGLLDASDGNANSSIHQAYMAWYAGQIKRSPSSDLGEWTAKLTRDSSVNAVRAPGQTCLSALAAGGHGTVTEPINNSKGCGGVMRVAPIAWLIPDIKEAVHLAVQTTAMTHGHPLGYQSSALLVWLLSKRLNNSELLSPITHELVNHWPNYDELLKDLIQWALDFGDRSDAPRTHPQLLGEGWVGEEALSIALCQALRAEKTSKPLSEILWDAAAHDGDSDSTAAITGNLIVAPQHDSQSVRALQKLDALSILLDAADTLIVLLEKN